MTPHTTHRARAHAPWDASRCPRPQRAAAPSTPSAPSGTGTGRRWPGAGCPTRTTPAHAAAADAETDTAWVGCRVGRRGAAARAALAALPVALMVVVALVLLPGVASAAAELVPMQGQEPAPAASVDQVLTNIRNWIMGIAGGLATVFFSVGAVRYMAAGGDLGEVEKAKTAFRSAAFGYAIAVLAPLGLEVLRGIVGA